MKNIMKVFAVITFVLGGITFNSSAVDAEQTQKENVYIEQINESTMQLHLEDEITFEQNENGQSYLVDTSNNQEETLPTQTTDANGNQINLVYEQNEDGVEVQLQNLIQPFGWLQCSLGTAGGIGSGGLAGAGVGSAVPGIGTVAGGIIGGISTGMTGAAASCF
ncbi:hypothetical protein [Salinicoccus albus]|uniref:hypothetical protein n=1 Tax=Salinicoccus albus TaxID=418756 RepID=UPI0003657C87|nr:hypothetical protein [Salinicoccus albus]